MTYIAASPPTHLHSPCYTYNHRPKMHSSTHHFCLLLLLLLLPLLSATTLLTTAPTSSNPSPLLPALVSRAASLNFSPPQIACLQRATTTDLHPLLRHISNCVDQAPSTLPTLSRRRRKLPPTSSGLCVTNPGRHFCCVVDIPSGGPAANAKDVCFRLYCAHVTSAVTCKPSLFPRCCCRPASKRPKSCPHSACKRRPHQRIC